MANQVYANNMEVSCKAAAGKSICAFPDVCMTPPENPATPPGVPIPYPNTGMASDCTEGSKTVKISNQEIMLKDKSYFKRSTGDEAGCAAKKGVVTSVNMGKVYFTMWSMDVKVEGENVVRNLDLTTHNHASLPSNTAPWPYVDEAATPGITAKCEKDMEAEKKACEGVDNPCRGLEEKPPSGEGVTRADAKPHADRMAEIANSNDCINARRCRLSPYDKNKSTCCPGQTGHHLVEASSFGQGRGGGDSRLTTFSNSPEAYDEGLAPCVCAEGTSSAMGGTHELMHVFQKAAASKVKTKKAFATAGGDTTKPLRATNYGQAKASGLDAMGKVFEDSGCSRECIEAQIDAYHQQCGINNDTECIAVTAGPSESTTSVAEANKEIAQRSWERWVSRGPQGAD
jgi:hypothetical protein